LTSGLARISRYNPRTRTKRLPVEPVSQSSANQRKGRAGRVQDGVCIRLYSEEDFAERPPSPSRKSSAPISPKSSCG
jgi:ATP-dependent helicase HrpA